MTNLTELQRISGIVPETIVESKYGTKFDRFVGPFKNRGDKILDKNDKFVAECDSTELAKEMAAILTDIRKMREICERFISLSR